VSPDLFNRIELRDIRWQIFHSKTPAACDKGKDDAGAMRLQTIPHDHGVAWKVFHQLVKEGTDVNGVDGNVGMQPEEQPEVSQERRTHQRCNRRNLLMRATPLMQNGRPSLRSESSFGPRGPSGSRFRRSRRAGLLTDGLFFHARPSSQSPPSNAFLVAFHSTPFRSLGGPAQRSHQARDVVNMVADTQLTLDDHRDSWTRPEITWKSTGLSTFEQQAFKSSPPPSIKPRRTSGIWACSKTPDPVLSVGSFPSSNTATIDTKPVGDIHRAQALPKQGHRLVATLLQKRSLSRWSHKIPSIWNIGHYLCRSQQLIFFK